MYALANFYTDHAVEVDFTAGLLLTFLLNLQKLLYLISQANLLPQDYILRPQMGSRPIVLEALS